jgi:putative membrane protein
VKHYIKSFIITATTFYITYSLVPAIKFGPDPANIIIVIGGFWVISQIINPIFSLVLLPINVLTFGLVSLVLNIAFVFALLRLIPGFTIEAFNFAGFDYEGIVLPAYYFSATATALLIAIVMTFVQKILHLIFE